MPEKTFADLTRELRDNGWQPQDRYWCGCHWTRLCLGHAEMRALEHYHPQAPR